MPALHATCLPLPCQLLIHHRPRPASYYSVTSAASRTTNHPKPSGYMFLMQETPSIPWQDAVLKGQRFPCALLSVFEDGDAGGSGGSEEASPLAPDVHAALQVGLTDSPLLACILPPHGLRGPVLGPALCTALANMLLLTCMQCLCREINTLLGRQTRLLTCPAAAHAKEDWCHARCIARCLKPAFPEDVMPLRRAW